MAELFDPETLIAQAIDCNMPAAQYDAEWLDEVVAEVIAHLGDNGYSIVPEGHARIDGHVVRITHARNHKYDYEGAYVAGTFCGWIDDKADTYGRCADGFYKPLYVVEAPDA